MGVRSAAVAALFFFASHTNAAPACDRNLLSTCAQLATTPTDANKTKGLGLSTAADGGVIFNASAYFALQNVTDPKITGPVFDDLKRIADPSPARIKMSLAVIKRVRKKAREVIIAGTSLASLSAEQKNLLHRLDTVRIEIADAGDFECTSSIPLGLPNAAYTAASHTMSICPGVLSLTATQIEQVLGHEFGHVVDPCTAEFPVLKVNAAKMNDDNLKACDRSFVANIDTDDSETEAKVISKLRLVGATNVTGNVGSSPFSDLLKCGILTLDPLAPGTKSTLFRSTVECIAKTNEAKYEQTVNEYAVGFSTTSAPSPEKIANIKAGFPASCFDLTKEHFADSFESAVLSKIAAEEAWTPATYRTALMTPQGFSCLEDKIPGILINDHPLTSFRIGVIMNNSTAQRQLACEPLNEPKLCPLTTETSGASVTPTRRSGAAKSTN